MTMFQRDRALAACVLDCDFIYEALDGVSSDGDTGRCRAVSTPHPRGRYRRFMRFVIVMMHAAFLRDVCYNFF